jgi:hypothetical protein
MPPHHSTQGIVYQFSEKNRKFHQIVTIPKMRFSPQGLILWCTKNVRTSDNRDCTGNNLLIVHGGFLSAHPWLENRYHGF